MEISPTDVLEASEMLATRRVMSVPFGSESGLYIKRRFTSMVKGIESSNVITESFFCSLKFETRVLAETTVGSLSPLPDELHDAETISVNAVRMAYIGINFFIYVTLFKVQIYNYFVNDCIENVLNSQTKPKNLSYNVEY